MSQRRNLLSFLGGKYRRVSASSPICRTNFQLNSTWDGESEARTTAPTEITTAPVLSEVHTFEGINGAPLNQSDQDKDSADTPKTDVLSRVEDEEEHKRRQRAQRFGIPVVEPVVTKKTKGKSKTLTIEATPNEV